MQTAPAARRGYYSEMIFLNKIRVAVLFGGMSSEHDVSLLSAASVIAHIPSETFETVCVGITKAGRWLLYTGGTGQIADGSWEKDAANVPAFVSPDAGTHGIVALRNGLAEVLPIDVAFPVLHGLFGEDGTVQGLFALARIPCVGCGVLASAVCMDKAVAKALADAYGLPQAKWHSALAKELQKDGDDALTEAERKLGYPMFVKPANAGSSVGVSKAHDRAELRAAVAAAAKHDGKLVFEEAITGREIECAVLGGEPPVASCPGEIMPCNEFYDYDAKYLAGRTELGIPADLPEETSARVRTLALRAFACYGCAGLTRMDFFVRENGEVLLNEPNTIPGFTAISMYPKLFEASGIPYGALLEKLLRLALES